MQVDLNGKVALVTGAARGIGDAIAGVLAANGAEVVGVDIDESTLAQSVATSPHRHARVLDVTDGDAVGRVIDDVVSEFGALDVLVNNAGVNTLSHRVTIDAFPESEWHRILDVDLNGLYLVSRAGAAVMKKAGGGRIINIASVAGLIPFRLQCAFVAAKAAVINLSRAMAIELGEHGVLVNAIAPGSTLTEATKALFYGDDGSFHARAQEMLDHVPLGRPATVEEIAHAALFLAAPESSYITGTVLTVDGADPLPNLDIFTFDLKNFFTMVPQERFLQHIDDAVNAIRDHNAAWKFF